MNLEHIRLFVRIAALNNISLAGKELGLSPAASSAQMNKLEEDLGVRLLHRTTRRVSLTEEGKAFLPHAADLLDNAETARASVGSGTINPKGKLRVAASASFGRLHLIPALDQFLQQYPDLRVDIYFSDSVMDMVEGGFDVAVRDAELHDSSLIARKLAPVRRILCASPDYLAQYGEPKTPEDLLHHQCVSLMGLETLTFEPWRFPPSILESSTLEPSASEPSTLKPSTLESLAGPTRIKTQNRVRIDSGEAVRDAAVHRLGITLNSTWCCYQHIQQGDLVQVLKDYPLVSNTAIWAVYPSSRLLAPKVRAFIDYFADYFGDEPYWDEALD